MWGSHRVISQTPAGGRPHPTQGLSTPFQLSQSQVGQPYMTYGALIQESGCPSAASVLLPAQPHKHVTSAKSQIPYCPYSDTGQ